MKQRMFKNIRAFVEANVQDFEQGNWLLLYSNADTELTEIEIEELCLLCRKLGCEVNFEYARELITVDKIFRCLQRSELFRKHLPEFNITVATMYNELKPKTYGIDEFLSVIQ